MKLNVNGADVEVDDRFAASPLLWVLRDVLGVHGTKYGCGIGYCAACMVLIDGRNTKSCQTPAGRATGKAVTTVEGASGPVVDAVRDAWYRGNVVQCGYCQPGQTLAASALLEADRSPDDAAIGRWMNGNLCRCGTYPRIRDAIGQAAGALAAGRVAERVPVVPELEMQPLTEEDLADPVHPYVRVHQDGTVVAYSNQIEMGQGVHTGLATIVAEELDADFASVRVVNAANGAGPGGDVYGTPAGGGFIQLSGASTSTVGFWARYRLAAAQARARLVAAAAEAWGVPVEEVEISSGVVSHRGGKRAGFGDLAVRAAQLPVPDGVQPKDPGRYKLIGREGRLRVDSPGKILGTTRFTIDVTLPGMLTAVVLHPPKFGATPAAVDDSAALAEPGVTAVVPIAEGIAVVGETFDDAQRGLRALRVDWDEQNAERRSSEELLAEHRRLVESGEQAVLAREDGDVAAALADAAHVVDATYELPYLAHAPMEPNNAVCRMGDDGILEVWAGTEGPTYVRMAAAAGIGEDRVRVHVPYAGGSFGLHSSSGRDPVSEAVQVARALGWKYPVKLQSLREEELKSGRYRAMAVHRVRASADAQGRLTAFWQQIAAEPTSPNLPFVADFLFKNGVDYMTTSGAINGPYALPNFKLETTNVQTGVPIMVWRSVANSHTEFGRESAIDELAIAAGRDPVDLRRDLLADNPRTLRQRPNLTIRGDVTIDRVLFDGTTATGVLAADGTVYRGREVILSGGTYGSPAILLRSGVGPADELTALGIGAVADLPVGQRLQDQPGYYNAYALAPGFLEMTPAAGSLLWTASREAAGDELDLHVTATHLMDGSLSPTGGAIVVMAALVQPESTGTLKLASRDPGDAPLIDANYLGTGHDARRMLEAVKLGRAIARNRVFAPFIAAELTPGDAVADDDTLAQVIAVNLAVYGHPTSTAPMGGSGDPWAVVDSVGAVKGVSGLRVADASIIPEVPSATTNVTVIMLAERIYQRVYAS